MNSWCLWLGRRAGPGAQFFSCVEWRKSASFIDVTVEAEVKGTNNPHAVFTEIVT